MKYFRQDNYTQETLKKEYRKLCKELHPDHGGNETSFKEMQMEYEKLQMNTMREANKDKQGKTVELSPELLKALQKIIHLDMDIDLIGTWLWVGGATYDYKDVLKAAGFKWNRKRCKWFFAETKASGTFKGDYEELKAHHGALKIGTAQAKQITA